MRSVYMAFFFLFLATLLKSQEESVLTFPKSKLHIAHNNRHAFVNYEGLPLTDLAGHPQLPFRQYLVPDGFSIDTIELVETDTILLNYPLWPAQKAMPLSKNRKDLHFTSAEPSVYQSEAPYPQKIYWQAGENTLRVYPLQYLPQKNMLLAHTKIRLSMANGSLRFSTDNTAGRKPGNYLPGTEFNRAGQSDPVAVEDDELYLIITSMELATSFDTLLQWKRQKGLNAQLVSTRQVYDEFEGKDRQEKIRNFIRHQYLEHGTRFVLLGGDSSQVPLRYAWAMDCEYPWGPETQNDIPCDLYYGDLDGNWDANGNGIYGEVADEISLDQEVFVGRLPAGDPKQAQVMASKLVRYEKNPDDSYLCDMLFLAEILWEKPYTNSGLALDRIDSLYVPECFKPVKKLYEASGNENEATVVPALEQGYHIINHNGHAWYDNMGAGEYSISIPFVSDLQNGARQSVIFSIGCWPAAFDYDCIASKWLANPNGGAVAFFGNSRYGWGSPGNPEYGYSDLLNRAFYQSLFEKGIVHAGQALADAKLGFIPYAQQENVYRWVYYEVNLLGDPEMPIWKKKPEQLKLTGLPDTLFTGPNHINFNIQDAGQEMFRDARICLMQENGIYATAKATASGQFSLALPEISTMEPVLLTITAPGYLPFQKEIPVMAGQARPKLLAYHNQHENHELRCFETSRISLKMSNYGGVIKKLQLRLESRSDAFVLTDSIYQIEQMDGPIMLTDAFSVQQIKDVPAYENVAFKLHISWDDGTAYITPLSFKVVKPDIRFAGYFHADSSQWLDNGQSHALGLIISNAGGMDYRDFRFDVSTKEGRIEFLPSTLQSMRLKAHSVDTFYTMARVMEGSGPDFPEGEIMFHSPCDSAEKTIAFPLAIGQNGFFDDMENGSTNWTPSGWLDHWHISTNRAHSGTHSWYCGYPDSLHYQKGMRAYLQSKPVVCGTNPQLQFYAWYELPNYGTNGLTVETSDDGNQWHKHDYFGSGGALPLLSTGNNWMPYTYDLSAFHQPGDTIQLRFTFSSTWEKPTEGMYIDDVRIGNMPPQIETNIETGPENHGWEVRVSPNPIDAFSKLYFYSEKPSKYHISVYDFTGRFMMKLNERDLPKGESAVTLSGLQVLGSGIYLLKISSKGTARTKKILLP